MPLDTEQPRKAVVIGQADGAQDESVDTSFQAPPTETLAVLPNGGENDASTESENVGTTTEQRTFGGLTPREAGLRSAEARRRQSSSRDADAIAQSSGKVLLVRVPVAIGDIMGRLSDDAKRGSTQAARELRSYLEAYPAEDATDMSVLDARTRQQVIAKLLEDIESTEGSPPDGPVESEAVPPP